MLAIQEKILLHQIKNGNQQAFAQLYDTYKEKIYRFIYFRVSDEERAEDLANDVFMRIFDYIQKGNTIENFRAFLYQIARNLIIDFYRTRDHEALPIDEFIEENIPEKEDLEEKIDIKLDIEKIKESVKKLPDPYQEVIVLRFIEGMSFKEIARLISTTEDNARQRAHRGIKKLKKMLKTPS